MIAFPEELTILGRTYAILPIPLTHAREGTLGIADYVGGVLYIDTSLEPALVMNMIWHEAFHIIQQEIQGDINEEQARLVGVFVHSLLVQNPDMLGCYCDLLAEPDEDETEVSGGLEEDGILDL